MITVLAALIAMPTFGESGTMPAANYQVKSDLVDEKAAGGFSVSENASWSMLDVAVEGRALELVVKKNACCVKGGSCPMILALVNGTPNPIWFKAQDSRLELGREAKDLSGTWRPIEFRIPSDCGNSYHHVALSAGRVWTWDVPEDNGSFTTKCRYALYGQASQIYSNEFEAKINSGVFLLPEEWSRSYKVRPDGRLAPAKS